MTAEKHVLIVTKSDDNPCIRSVSRALLERGATPIRLDTDKYPEHIRLSSSLTGSTLRRTIVVADKRVDISEIDAVWYRRFEAGASLPTSLGDMRAACVGEARRALLGTIGAIECFQLDRLENVRRCDHKELQMHRAAALGLKVPRTLISNDPVEVERFCRETDGEVITKMQHSFAIYRTGQENVVFTNIIDDQARNDLDGLKYSPMVFQKKLTKKLELRATIVGKRVFCAAIDSQKNDETSLDWRRDGVGLLREWFEFQLPIDVEQALLELMAELGLNYGAADFVLTPNDDLYFLEVNAVGEYFWLEHVPGQPISGEIADVLLGRKERNQVRIGPWMNHTGATPT